MNKETELKSDTIAFIGLGLIGGSIARAIKEKYPRKKIYALARHEETIKEAFELGLIENSTLLPLEVLAKCDIIFLCSPVRINIAYIKKLKTLISGSTLITDVGSVKGDIHQAVADAGMSDHFIGGHPMTGSEAIGFSHSSSLFLENAYYILTTDSEKMQALLPAFADFIRSLGALPVQLKPDEHDMAVAAISHLPHIISASLVNLVRDSDNDDELLKTLAAGGFRDITRISSSSPEMWMNICISNRDAILKLIDSYKKVLDSFRNAIEFKNIDEMMRLFGDAKEYRDSMPLKKTSVLPRAYLLYCELRDEAGQIANVASLLATNAISIKNIGIIHNREFEDGICQIEFSSEDDKEKAAELLTNHNYELHDRN